MKKITAKVILTVGLPGSGKSMWSKEIVNKSNGTTKRINRDDIRAMFDNGIYSKNNEKFVVDVRNSLIISALKNNFNVIVDDTNLNNKNLDDIKNLIKREFPNENIKVEENTTFLDVTVDECIKRDMERERTVGSNVILNMVRDNPHRFLNRLEIVHNNTNSDKNAIICDIDGTLANLNGRNPYDASTCINDLIHKHIVDIVKLEDSVNSKIILVSGRSSLYRDETVEWLEKNNIPYGYLFMRDKTDKRKDSIVKKEIYLNEIYNLGYNIKYVLDDRDQVVEMWRHELGLKCLQVAFGNF